MADQKSEENNAKFIIKSLIAGALAGALAKSTIAPLDRTKINFQISNKPYSTRKALRFIYETYHNTGVFSLWRGNSATMARIVPYAAIQFCAHEQWKRVLHVDTGTEHGKSYSNQRRFVAGALAGVTSQTATYPLDLARARMAVTKKQMYNSLTQVFVKIWQTEGPMAFYKGYVPTVLGVIPYAGTSFYTYGTLKNMAKEYGFGGALTNLCCGAVAGVIGQTSSYPLDIVRRRMQTSAVTSHDKYNTILGTIRHVYVDEGIVRGFFKGLSMNWIKGPIAASISFATYDQFKLYLGKII